MNHIDLFSGIGGFALASNWAGFQTEVFCERDEFCKQVLRKHWPAAPIVDDIHDMHFDIMGNFFEITKNGDVMGRRKQEKYDSCVFMYNSGLSIEDCAEFFGITRQAMHKIMQRRGVVFRENLRYGEDNHFFRGGIRASDRAQNLVEKAIIKGILTRQPCEVCGDSGFFVDGRNRVQAHHDNYGKPLEVRWLCQHHHHEWHKFNIAKGESEEPANSNGQVLITGGFP